MIDLKIIHDVYVYTAYTLVIISMAVICGFAYSMYLKGYDAERKK